MLIIFMLRVGNEFQLPHAKISLKPNMKNPIMFKRNNPKIEKN